MLRWTEGKPLRAAACLFAWLMITGCGGGAAVAATPEGGSGPAVEARLMAGDYVVYDVRGAMLDASVEMREVVLARRGNTLVLAVELRRGQDRLHWLQVVTDTEENRKSDKVDALYVLEDDGVLRQLPNEGNADIMRLSAWTLPPCDFSRVEPRDSMPRRVVVGTGASLETLPAVCQRLHLSCAERPGVLELCQSHAFSFSQVARRFLPDEGEGEAPAYLLGTRSFGRFGDSLEGVVTLARGSSIDSVDVEALISVLDALPGSS